MNMRFDPAQYEKKWIVYWDNENVYETRKQPHRSKKYILTEFPYPSGSGLHIGHTREYTGGDILARFYRMNGENVLHPTGWDAFGLPTENAAIKEGVSPQFLTKRNIATFKNQMKLLGLSYDWDREINTADKDYYKITQWLFIQFFKLGLLQKKEMPVYYCKQCETGLAQEEVLSDGNHERCGNPVVQKQLPQWVFRITKYADDLLKGLDGLDWPSGVVAMQKNWIGRKEGIVISYQITDTDYMIDCFTTRPDTNFGATFIVLAPEHEFVASLLNSKFKIQSSKLNEIKKYIEKTKSKTEIERLTEGRKKTGVFTGFYALNNLNGKLMPIWISDFVLGTYGTGAVVGVPGHDKRDFEFAKEFNLDVIRVVVANDGDESEISRIEQVQEKEGFMVNSGFLNGLDIYEAKEKITGYLIEKRDGKKKVIYSLRDWVFSRQRYWGEPIPMIYCKRCAHNNISYWKFSNEERKTKNIKLSGEVYLNTNKVYQKNSKWVNEVEKDLYGWFPVEEKDLPIELPDIKDYKPSKDGKSALSKLSDFVKTKCPHCGGKADRETDTMPNWAGSCWYFLAYTFWGKKIPNLKFKIQNSKLIENWKLLALPKQSEGGKIGDSGNDWLPVDIYIGGAEHTVLHLLYSRFWIKMMFDLGLITFDEPFTRRIKIGIVIAEDGRKMSKSYGNVINPDKVIAEYGADTIRVYEMFMAPFSQEVRWSTQALQGSYRFLKRIWQIYNNSANITNKENEEDKALLTELQTLILKISSDITNVKFNTSISSMMEFVNFWQKPNIQAQNSNVKTQNHNLKLKTKKKENKEAMKQESYRKLYINNAKIFLQLLAPFAPFITEELWHRVLGEKQSIHLSSWPKADSAMLKIQTSKIPIQINGKTRDVLEISSQDISKNTVISKALESDKVNKWVGDKKYEVIYIEGKIINFVLTK